MKEYRRVEYMCTYCGGKAPRPSNMGRPQPGTCSKRGKRKDGTAWPHRWVINRKY